MSNFSPRCFQAIAEHSMCQPGRPSALMLAGDGHDGSPGFDGFHSTKSVLSRLYGATSTRAPAIISSSERFDKDPHLRDMLGRTRLHRRRQAAECGDVVLILLIGLFGDCADRLVQGH